MGSQKPEDVRIEIAKHGSWVVAYTPEAIIPKSFTARIDKPDWPLVSIRIECGRKSSERLGPMRPARCDKVCFEARSTDEPLLAKNIAKVKVATAIEWAIAEALEQVKLESGRRYEQIRITDDPTGQRMIAAAKYRAEAGRGRGRPRTPSSKRAEVMRLWEELAGQKRIAEKIAKRTGLKRSKVFEIRRQSEDEGKR